MSMLSIGFNRFFSKVLSRTAVRRSRQNSPMASCAVASCAAAIEMLETRQLLTVTYHGGSVLANVEAQAVYLGSDWQTNAALQTQTGQFDQFLTTLVSGQYVDMLTNAGYGVGRGTSSAGVTDTQTLNKTSGITDAAIQKSIQALITANKLQTPDANRLYVVYVEPGVVAYNGSTSSQNTFLGYHGAFGGKTSTGTAADIHYVVIPYPDGVNPTHTSQGFSTSFSEQTAVTSHEVAEAITDPNVNYKNLGWYDDQNNGEIGDLTRLTVVYNGYLVQEVVDKNDQPIAPETVTTTTLTAPQNVTLTAINSTTASLTWNPVSGTQGYRIYQVNGTQSVLLGSLSASSTSVQITGLTAGAKVSFKVEAYNASTVADSTTVSMTMPVTGNLTAPKLSATILSATSVQLNWNSVAGTDGYKIYWSDGVHRYLLGSVGAGVTSVRITGLSSGATYQFQVEAFHASTIADSAWVTVNPAAHQVQKSHVASSVEQGIIGMPVIARRSRRG